MLRTVCVYTKENRSIILCFPLFFFLQQIVEPFLSSCRQRSKVLYQVISSVRSQMATTSPPGAPLQIQSALEELDKLYNASSCNPDLIGLLAEGPRILQEVSNAKTRLGGDNVDAR